MDRQPCDQPRIKKVRHMAVRHPEIGEIRSLVEGELDQIRSAIVREHIARCDKCAALWSTAFGLILDRFEPTEELSTADEQCPDPESLAAYHSEGLVEPKREAIERHLSKCSLCRYSLRCLELLPEEAEDTSCSLEAGEFLAPELLEDRRPSSTIRAALLKCQDMSTSIVHSLRKAVDAVADATIQVFLAVRQCRARRVVGCVRNGWEELGRELQGAAAEDICPQRFDRQLLRLEARISRGLGSLRYLESRTNGHNGLPDQVDAMTGFMRGFVSERMRGTLARGEARIMIEEWNGYYWLLNELMTTARPMRQERKRNGKGGGKSISGVLKSDSEIWQVAAGVAAVFLFAAVLKHGDWLNSSLAQPLWYGSNCVLSGIGDGFFALGSLLSDLKLNIQLIVSKHRALVTLLSVVILPIGMYYVFKLMLPGTDHEAAYAPRR